MFFAKCGDVRRLAIVWTARISKIARKGPFRVLTNTTVSCSFPRRRGGGTQLAAFAPAPLKRIVLFCWPVEPGILYNIIVAGSASRAKAVLAGRHKVIENTYTTRRKTVRCSCRYRLKCIVTCI